MSQLTGITVLLWLQQYRETFGPASERIFSILSDILLAAGIVIAVYMYWCLDKKTGRKMLFMLGTGLYFNTLIKQIMRVPRPWVLDERITPSERSMHSASGYSFPSTHTQLSTMMYGALSARYKKSTVIFIITALSTLMVGFTRMYLGVHTPADVVVGALLGLFFLYASDKAVRALNSKRRRQFAVILFVIANLALLAYTLILHYPATPDKYRECLFICGIGVGIAGGMYLETTKLNFTLPENRTDRIKRFVIGLVFTGVVFAVLNMLSDMNGLDLIFQPLKGFALGFIILYVYPLWFSR